MKDVLVKVTLDETIEAAEELTRNKIAVEGKIRPATLSELCNGKSKSITFATLSKIAGAMTEITGKEYTIEDVIKIEYR